MAGVLWELLAVLLGCLAVRRITRSHDLPLAWLIGGGALFGIGLTSIVFFVFRLILPGWPKASMACEAALAAWLVWDAARNRNFHLPVPRLSGWLEVSMTLALVGAIAIATSTFFAAWQAIPQGDWDAWSIWNLRAKFLAAGGIPQNAWSPKLSSTHPEYPLLVSSFVARNWTYAGSMSSAVPAALSYLCWLSMLAIGGSSVARLRGVPVGIGFALALCVTPAVLRKVPAQYADLPLAALMLASVAALLLDELVLAGCFAGFAAWTKDEGLLFCVGFLLLIAALRRAAIVRTVIGAVPGLLVAVYFKLFLAPAGSSMLAKSSSGIAGRLADGARYGQIVSAFGSLVPDFGSYPLIILVLTGVAAGLRRTEFPATAFAAAICGVMLAGYFGAYLITGNDLAWQLSTSADRVLTQVWPCILLTAFLSLRSWPGQQA